MNRTSQMLIFLFFLLLGVHLILGYKQLREGGPVLTLGGGTVGEDGDPKPKPPDIFTNGLPKPTPEEPPSDAPTGTKNPGVDINPSSKNRSIDSTKTKTISRRSRRRSRRKSRRRRRRLTAARIKKKLKKEKKFKSKKI